VVAQLLGAAVGAALIVAAFGSEAVDVGDGGSWRWRWIGARPPAGRAS
jgi:hypothetical protein